MNYKSNNTTSNPNYKLLYALQAGPCHLKVLLIVLLELPPHVGRICVHVQGRIRGELRPFMRSPIYVKLNILF